jgi:cell division protease FtsH
MDKNKQEKKFEFRMQLDLKKIVIWGLVLTMFVPALISFLGSSSGMVKKMSLTEAIGEIKDGKIDRVEVRGDEVVLFYPDDSAGDKPIFAIARKEEGSSFVEIANRYGLLESDIKIEIVSQSGMKFLGSLASILLPILGIGLIMMFVMRRQMGGASDMFGMGKSKAKLFFKGKQSIKFADVAGVDEAKAELEEVVDFLKNSKKYKDLGARTPKGVLLTGPSGVGKTLLARAVAGEAGVPFLSMAGSEFMEMLVGVGASRVRDLFDTAKKSSPSIIFIDEIDAIGRTRGAGGSIGGHDEREQTLNQILVEMDGFGERDNVIVIGATNRPDVLDPALVRPGRFDRRVTLDLPDIAGRKEVIAIHRKGKPFTDKVDWDKVAQRTVGFSGADLENMLNESAILAARENRKSVEMKDIEEAAMKVKMGPEKKRLQSEKERKMTAYHEAGHAVVGHFLPGTNPIHRVSIVSRGMALGFTMSRPKTDKYQQTMTELKNEIAMMLGGRAAEEIFFDELTAGASSDIERATMIARRMVVDFGMSPLGPMSFASGQDTNSWGYAYGDRSRLSESLQMKVDDEIKKIIDDGHKLAIKTINEKKDEMNKLVEKLMKVETVEQEVFEEIVGGPKLDD